MKIIFMLKTGVIEWPIPEDLRPQFNFNACATSTRINGFFMAENLYIRHEELIGMSIAPDDMPADRIVRRDLN